jgi:hypothetical protein
MQESGDVCVWEILVPVADNNGRAFTIEHHRKWDDKVKEIARGLTVMGAAKRGIWISPQGEEFDERMIFVRIACSDAQIEEIAEFTRAHYDQLKVCIFKHQAQMFLHGA